MGKCASPSFRVCRWVLASLPLVVACGEASAPPPPAGGGSSGGAALGAAGEAPVDKDTSAGSGGTDEGSSPVAGGAGAHAGEDGGAGGHFGQIEGAAGGDGSSPAPIDRACSGELAFAVSGGAFLAPTERALAVALNDYLFNGSPITFALRVGEEEASVAASYTTEAFGKQAFPDALAPDPTPAWVADGGFGTLSAQSSGYLLVSTGTDSIEVPLQNLAFTVTTQDGCARGVARLSATIPAQRRDLVDRLTGVPTDVPEEEPGRTENVETPIQALFDVIQVDDFDFGSMP